MISKLLMMSVPMAVATAYVIGFIYVLYKNFKNG